MKFGGASVASPQHFSNIADIISYKLQEYSRLIIVVSAMGKTTDDLIQLAKQINPSPPRREYDMLVSVGERISISLLAMALAAKNREAISFTGSQSGIITTDEHSEARILEVRPHRLIPCLDKGKIVIVAGFQGVSQKGEITTLGRGGSDTTAVALGVAFRAKVEFYKDVPGFFTTDPKLDPTAKHIPFLSHQEALGYALNGAKILHPRSLELATKNGLPLQIFSFHGYPSSENRGTLITSKDSKVPDKPLYEECIIT